MWTHSLTHTPIHPSNWDGRRAYQRSDELIAVAIRLGVSSLLAARSCTLLERVHTHTLAHADNVTISSYFRWSFLRASGRLEVVVRHAYRTEPSRVQCVFVSDPQGSFVSIVDKRTFAACLLTITSKPSQQVCARQFGAIVRGLYYHALPICLS